MKKKVAFMAVILFCILGMVAEGGAKEFLSLLTCGTAGVYFPLGGGIARIWNKYIPDVNATAESSGCSVVNLRLMEQGQASAAICQNDAVYFAAKGLKFFEAGKKAMKPRGVLMLYDELLHVATTKQSGIKTMTDLKGKRVRIGFPGSIATENALIVLKAYGLTEKDIKAYQISLADAFEQIKDGNIDALIEPTGAPGAGFLDLAHSRDMFLIPIDREHSQKIHKQYPFLSQAVFPAGVYKGIDRNVPTLAVTSMLVASSDLSNDLVYKMTKAIFEHLAMLGESHVKGKLVSLETALKGMPIPLHPGAEKYYREVGKIK
jgi:TRAP transporter TAXI family solute receptor